MPRIMIVDDDKSSLRALFRVLAADPTYEIASFTSPEEALASAYTKVYDLIIADLRMPGMDGITLLKGIKGVQPDALRIVLSGCCDRSSLYCAINEAQVARYVEKPYDPAVIRGIVSELVDSVSEIH